MTSELTGARLLAGTVVDPAGVLRSKQVPIAHAGIFASSGMGASPSWNVFCIDNAVSFTPRFGVVGDLRLRIDLSTARLLGDGLAWSPADLVTQHGEPTAVCTRSLLRRTEAALTEHGLTALVGGELEFVLTQADGSPRHTPRWNAYGLSAVLDAEPFLMDLVETAGNIGLPMEQIHAEYGDGQFEFSLSPSDPVTAADNIVLARILTGRIARRHGLAVSFSPLPFADGAGNGAHLHLSLARYGTRLLSGGDGPHGLTRDGEAVIGGILAGLPDVIGVLAGSVLSAPRLRPGRWSGAFACWGLENREAAVRLCAATPGTPHGASVEVKCVDPSANPYLAASVLLGLALDGLERGAGLPPEVTVDPAEVPGTVRLPAGQDAALAALGDSPLARRLLGEEILEALTTVRGHELETYGKEDLATVAEKLRFTW
ncbi:MAG TPA: glutamine synthetase family protein [Amycolatopsis sp.]|uniref:glutamine synthetase family protein n=1 Tax=Amycolatopsis sp. TaxID=37632 RepID=UPI002B4A9DC9|nr:glutamine synthetase family protein [Amycolatopsis sp.]HKS44919.1 glutamine synthetase family protein [Amycolatopsis sp.]